MVDLEYYKQKFREGQVKGKDLKKKHKKKIKKFFGRKEGEKNDK